MKVTDLTLTKIEEQKGVIIIQSDFPEIAYAVDKENQALYIINRQTGQELQIDAENVYKFAFEMMDVADLYIPKDNLFKKGA